MFNLFRPACPLDALPDLLYNAACEIGQLTEAPAEVLLSDAIAAVSLAVCPRYDVRSYDGRTMPTSIFTAALAGSGIGKGQSMAQFFKSFKEDTKEKLRLELATGQPAQTNDELILEEVTLPALMDRLHGIGKSCSIQFEEGERFIQTMLNLGNILTPLWSGDPPVRRLVKGHSRTAMDARLCIGFRIQPKLFYEDLLKDGGRTYKQGLWARFLLACHDPERFPTPQPLMTSRAGGSGHNDRLQAVLKKFVAQAQQCPSETPRTLVALSKDAAVRMRMLKEDIKDCCPKHYDAIKPSVNRAWENTLRLAAVFHVVCEEEGEISQEMVERAWTIMEWSLTQHYMVFVEAARPESKQKPSALARSHAPRKARPADDARLVLEAVWSARSLRSSNEKFFDEVERLAGLPPKRFSQAIEWLVRKEQVVVLGVDEFRRIRALAPRPSYTSDGRL
ncbi:MULTISPECIES: DUF3987 domain-containing protein [Xanthomonas]|uniref:DUF3987 domain-containing protein n=1 Tax=Xanthomonas TaxID=338 RepID=UPI0023785119|nr:DUF3987 domain-containing protein [Xanthomonas campestris]WDL17315.1 DUF3987 domain-containing protein [Xanthomonas campestris pv. campestris]WDL21397.1 DUF3987 domain-containing protein [Xanthomonas campestris pv. campestris]WDL26521.1 DUF3987 domain-containing protein [Xanthomonas campestris pv. campestris]WDL29571.1 DUF3987 domain-containing protein [Xanthomonas campestris pv. campestris]WDL34703.1 DUF3987 domain-containing protein [Xanthomonas campestris pv. campestris]